MIISFKKLYSMLSSKDKIMAEELKKRLLILEKNMKEVADFKSPNIPNSELDISHVAKMFFSDEISYFFNNNDNSNFFLGQKEYEQLSFLDYVHFDSDSSIVDDINNYVHCAAPNKKDKRLIELTVFLANPNLVKELNVESSYEISELKKLIICEPTLAKTNRKHNGLYLYETHCGNRLSESNFYDLNLRTDGDYFKCRSGTGDFAYIIPWYYSNVIQNKTHGVRPAIDVFKEACDDLYHNYFDEISKRTYSIKGVGSIAYLWMIIYMRLFTKATHLTSSTCFSPQAEKLWENYSFFDSCDKEKIPSADEDYQHTCKYYAFTTPHYYRIKIR